MNGQLRRAIPDKEKVSYSVIQKAASTYPRVGLSMLTGIILVESGGWTFARRYEPGFYRRYFLLRPKKKLVGHIPETVNLTTEIHDRCTSWGLMQIMGETARETGYQGEHFIELCLRPAVCLDIGCQFLTERIEDSISLDKALLAYNGGADPSYPKRVRECANYSYDMLARFFSF